MTSLPQSDKSQISSKHANSEAGVQQQGAALTQWLWQN